MKCEYVIEIILYIQVEYEVEPCSKSNVNGSRCVDVKRASFPIQSGGYVIYGVGHLHTGAIGSTLYGQVTLNNCN